MRLRTHLLLALAGVTVLAPAPLAVARTDRVVPMADGSSGTSARVPRCRGTHRCQTDSRPRRFGHCVVPAHATARQVTARFEFDVVASDVGDALYGCELSVGRRVRLGESISTGTSEGDITPVATAGDNAALEILTEDGIFASDDFAVADLRTGRIRHLADTCTRQEFEPGGCDGIDSVLLNTAGVLAWHQTTAPAVDTSPPAPCMVTTSCVTEQIYLADATGVHAVDTLTNADGTTDQLAGLTLTATTLTWTDAGQPRSSSIAPIRRSPAQRSLTETGSQTVASTAAPTVACCDTHRIDRAGWRCPRGG